MSAPEVSAGDEPVRRHAHWDKVVAAAYLRMIGHTQAEAAGGVGRNARTIRLWEADTELWAAAREEARDRWLNDALDAARAAVLNSAKMGNVETGKWLLERLDEDLAPPKLKMEMAGAGGGPVLVAGLDIAVVPARPDEVPGAEGGEAEE